jgi:hypothetical protein
MKIDIRRASVEDYSALCGLFDEIDAFHRINLPKLFQKPNGPVRELDYYLGLISDENVACSWQKSMGTSLVLFM